MNTVSLEQARAWIAENAHRGGHSTGEIGPETNLLTTGILDSVELVQFIAWLEDATGRVIDLLELDPEEFGVLGRLLTAAGEQRE